MFNFNSTLDQWNLARADKVINMSAPVICRSLFISYRGGRREASEGKPELELELEAEPEAGHGQCTLWRFCRSGPIMRREPCLIHQCAGEPRWWIMKWPMTERGMAVPCARTHKAGSVSHIFTVYLVCALMSLSFICIFLFLCHCLCLLHWLFGFSFFFSFFFSRIGPDFIVHFLLLPCDLWPPTDERSSNFMENTLNYIW